MIRRRESALRLFGRYLQRAEWAVERDDLEEAYKLAERIKFQRRIWFNEGGTSNDRRYIDLARRFRALPECVRDRITIRQMCYLRSHGVTDSSFAISRSRAKEMIDEIKRVKDLRDATIAALGRAARRGDVAAEDLLSYGFINAIKAVRDLVKVGRLHLVQDNGEMLRNRYSLGGRDATTNS